MAKNKGNLSKKLLDCITEPTSSFSVDDASRLLALVDEMDIQDYISNEVMQCSGASMPAYFEVLKALRHLRQYKTEGNTEEEPDTDDFENDESSGGGSEFLLKPKRMGNSPMLGLGEDDDAEEE